MGFWAMNKSEELANENLTASILVRIENVTERVFSKINGSGTEEDRRKKYELLLMKFQMKFQIHPTILQG